MMLTRFYPGRPTRSLNRDFDRLVNQVFGDMPRPWTAPANDQPGHFHPAADVHETEDAYQIQVELPGVKQENVNVSIEDGVLTLSAEKKVEEEVKERNVWRTERTFGSFSRSFSFSHEIDADQVSATYRDGVLELTVPKAEQAKPRKIDVTVS
jgi:HSP20 family protein